MGWLKSFKERVTHFQEKAHLNVDCCNNHHHAQNLEKQQDNKWP